MRFCPGCVFQQWTLSEKPCAFCGRVPDPYPPRSAEKPHPFVRLVRWLLQPIGWPTHVIAIAATLLFLWNSSRGNIGFMSGLLIGFLTLFASVVWIGRLLVRCIVAAFYRRAPWAYRAGWKNWLVAPGLLAFTLILHETQVPVRIAFWLSRPAMERVVQQRLAAAQGKFLAPRRVGLYQAQDTEKLGQGVRFVAVKDAFLFTESYFGFAYFPSGQPPSSSPRKFMDWSSGAEYKSLGSNWFSWTETGSNF